MQFHHTPRFIADSLVSSYPGPDTESVGNTRYVIVQENGIVLPGEDPGTIFHAALPDPGGCPVLRTQYLGDLTGAACFAAEIPAGAPIPSGWPRVVARDLAGTIPMEETGIAAYAVQIIDFDRTTRFCGRCGAETRQLTTERAKQCPSCGFFTYPRLSPAIIVLVQKEGEILLARSPHFPPGMHSVIAGFVEPGETIEHAVSREVKEEAGIEIRNIRYVGSEPWPFPNSLMIGFTAEYAGGTLVRDPNEIESLGWFSRNNLPPLPSGISISRALIDGWLAGGD
ncbi:MAG: NAD(+) diphosphatase [Methanoregulaceae archaeon]